MPPPRSLDGDGDNSSNGLPPSFSFGVGADGWTQGHPALGGPIASTNTQRYANAAPMHSDGTRNEPRWSHLAALQNLIRNYTESLLTTSGMAAPTTTDAYGCAGPARTPLQCVVYAANTSAELTFAIGGSGGDAVMSGRSAPPNEPAATVSIYGRSVAMPADTVLIFGTDRTTVLWNSSHPPDVDLAAHAIRPSDAPLRFTSWTDAANMTWHSATFDAPTGEPTAVLLDLAGMRKGMAFVNGAHVAQYDLALASCTADGALPKPGVPNSFPQEAHWKPTGWCGDLRYVNGGAVGAGSATDTYPDGGCGQPSQRFYHVPADWLKPTGNTLLLTEHPAKWNGDSCVSGWGRAPGGCHYANAVVNLSAVAIVSRN
jgi:hypothetical protein